MPATPAPSNDAPPIGILWTLAICPHCSTSWAIAPYENGAYGYWQSYTVDVDGWPAPEYVIAGRVFYCPRPKCPNGVLKISMLLAARVEGGWLRMPVHK